MTSKHDKLHRANDRAVSAVVGAAAGTGAFVGAVHLLEEKAKHVQLELPLQMGEKATGFVGKAKEAIGGYAGKIGDVVKHSSDAFGNMPNGKKAIVLASTAAATAIFSALYMNATKPHTTLASPSEAQLGGTVVTKGHEIER